MKRHSDAIAISLGACNPIAIVGAMSRAIEEIRAGEHKDTDTILNDPALKLMTYQLAFLQGMECDVKLTDYGRWLDECEKNIKVVS